MNLSRPILAACATGAIIATLSACHAATGPNLDTAVAGQPVASIRERIAEHQDWGRRLSGVQLDELALFLHEYAGAGGASGGPPATDPGLALWRANGCASCHALSVGVNAP